MDFKDTCPHRRQRGDDTDRTQASKSEAAWEAGSWCTPNKTLRRLLWAGRGSKLCSLPSLTRHIPEGPQHDAGHQEAETGVPLCQAPDKPLLPPPVESHCGCSQPRSRSQGARTLIEEGRRAWTHEECARAGGEARTGPVSVHRALEKLKGMFSGFWTGRSTTSPSFQHLLHLPTSPPQLGLSKQDPDPQCYPCPP